MPKAIRGGGAPGPRITADGGPGDPHAPIRRSRSRGPSIHFFDAPHEIRSPGD